MGVHHRCGYSPRGRHRHVLGFSAGDEEGELERGSEREALTDGWLVAFAIPLTHHFAGEGTDTPTYERWPQGSVVTGDGGISRERGGEREETDPCFCLYNIPRVFSASPADGTGERVTGQSRVALGGWEAPVTRGQCSLAPVDRDSLDMRASGPLSLGRAMNAQDHSGFLNYFPALSRVEVATSSSLYINQLSSQSLSPRRSLNSLLLAFKDARWRLPTERDEEISQCP